MCAPCKIIINERNEGAGRTASLLRELTLNPPADRSAEDRDADDFLYELAKCEVEHIQAVRKMAVEFAKRHGASDRWVKLVGQI